MLQNWSDRVFVKVLEDVLSDVLLEILRSIWRGHGVPRLQFAWVD